MPRRFLFVRLPYFPIERFVKIQHQLQHKTRPFWEKQDESPQQKLETAPPPLVLVQGGAKGTLISAVGPQAQKEGFYPGMKLTDARSMMPNINVAHHDVVGDATLLSKLAQWMLRYTPSVAIYESDGFILDVHGCDHLFGGEEAMALDITARFEQMGFTVYLAFADTIAACHALVFHGARTRHILPSPRAPDALDSLPVEALRLDEATLTLLKRLGLKRIGDVRPIPRSALERRFKESRQERRNRQSASSATSVQWRLDQLAGSIAEPVCYIREPQKFRATKPCPDLALEQGAVGMALDELLPPLCAELAKAGKGGRQFILTGYRADGGYSSTGILLSQPAHLPPVIRRLFSDKLDRIDCGYGVDLFVLEASRTQPLGAGQHDMVDPNQAQQVSASLAVFADTIANRIAPLTVTKPAPRTSYVPERAQRLVDISTAVDWESWQAMRPNWSPRPLRLLNRPEPAEVTSELPDSPPAQFVWRKVMRRVIRARGPERILPEWWHDDLKTKRSAIFRDYYDVEDSEGLRYWIFRSIRDDPVTMEPPVKTGSDSDTKTSSVRTMSWFVHGLF